MKRHRVPFFERLHLGELPLVLQEHGHLGKEDFVFQLRVWAQVRTADFDPSSSLAAINLLTRLAPGIPGRAKPDAIVYIIYVPFERTYAYNANAFPVCSVLARMAMSYTSQLSMLYGFLKLVL